jgi:hypothetical protein
MLAVFCMQLTAHSQFFRCGFKAGLTTRLCHLALGGFLSGVLHQGIRETPKQRFDPSKKDDLRTSSVPYPH